MINMIKDLVGPFRLPPDTIEPGSNVRVMTSDEANVQATYCGDCKLIIVAPTGSWGIALRFANEHRDIHTWKIPQVEP